MAAMSYMDQVQNPSYMQNKLPPQPGKLLTCAKTQNGSRYIQNHLREPAFFEKAMKELLPAIPDLMMDNFGHYTIERMVMLANHEQKMMMVRSAVRDFSAVACHKQGSFSIQATMQMLDNAEQMQVIKEGLAKDPLTIMLSSSGHYVVLGYARVISNPAKPYYQEFRDMDFIQTTLLRHTVEICNDHYGLRCVKMLLDNCRRTIRAEVYQAMVDVIDQIVENQYGNYIVQHLLEVAPKRIKEHIIENLIPMVVGLSRQKFSSNVVERALKTCQLMYLKRIKADPSEGKHVRESSLYRILDVLSNGAADLINDRFGNYCLQSALMMSLQHIELINMLIPRVRPLVLGLRENIRAKWTKLLNSAEKQAGIPPTRSGGKIINKSQTSQGGNPSPQRRKGSKLTRWHKRNLRNSGRPSGRQQNNRFER